MLDDDLLQLKNSGNQSITPDDRPYFHARECLKRGDLIGAFEALHVADQRSAPEPPSLRLDQQSFTR
jgi:hypothetical protein